jgi:uncharacterized protein (DUF2147 family)
MMKTLLLPFLFLAMPSHAQTISGKWKTIDDETGDQRSIVEIFESGGRFYGRVIRIFPKPGENPDPVCESCEDDDPRKGKKVIGMQILTGLELLKDQYANGDILDPENGKVYRCKLWLEGNDLIVRGYWGPFYRTQTWKKAD